MIQKPPMIVMPAQAQADPAQEPEEEKANGEQEELLAVWWEDRKYSGLLDE